MYLEFPRELLDKLYSNLPIIASTRWKTIAVHGGIPKPKEGETASTLLRDLATKNTPLTIDIDNRFSKELMIQIYQTLWNDPYYGNDKEQIRFRQSYRGQHIYDFNRAALNEFLDANGHLRLVRAHETALDGYEVHWDEKLIHIFSASPYFDRVKTAAYFLEFEDGSGEIIDGKGKCLRKVDPPI
jgi:hypothetical protein